MPRYFLPLASLANVGKSVGLTTYIATQPVFLNSFIRHENLADINAKTQVRLLCPWLFIMNECFFASCKASAPPTL